MHVVVRRGRGGTSPTYKKGIILEDVTEIKEDKEQRELYVVWVSFMVPQAGPVQIIARDKDHAHEILTEAHKGVKDFQIVDTFNAEEWSKKVDMVKTETDDNPPSETTQLH